MGIEEIRIEQEQIAERSNNEAAKPVVLRPLQTS
jgi:hypothetical protein